MAQDDIVRHGRDVIECGNCAVSGVNAMVFQRITVDPEVCGGKPCIRGMRFPVSRLLGLLAAGETHESILDSYPYLEPEDIQEALRYAAFLADEEIVEFA
ncbi:MAG: DUF433 domain-containing protein [Caldilineaceae bacterium]|nr:DUF433 domain-containing protein [Caldilineaceae bacterium]